MDCGGDLYFDEGALLSLTCEKNDLETVAELLKSSADIHCNEEEIFVTPKFYLYGKT